MPRRIAGTRHVLGWFVLPVVIGLLLVAIPQNKEPVHQVPRPVELAVSPLPAAPTCTATQELDWKTVEQDIHTTKPASALWRYAHECAPATVTQTPRPANQVMDLGQVTGPNSGLYDEKLTIHTVWEGIPGNVNLTSAQLAVYRKAATTPVVAAACCNRSWGQSFTDNWWHCTTVYLWSHFTTWDTGQPAWDEFTLLAYCSNYQHDGGVVWRNSNGVAVNAAPVHFAYCLAYQVEGEADLRLCYGAPSQSGVYVQSTGDTNPKGTFVVKAFQWIADEPAPLWTTKCTIGYITQEFHIHRSHRVYWEGDIYGTGTWGMCGAY